MSSRRIFLKSIGGFLGGCLGILVISGKGFFSRFLERQTPLNEKKKNAVLKRPPDTPLQLDELEAPHSWAG